MNDQNHTQDNEGPLVLQGIDDADTPRAEPGEERTFRTDAPDTRPDLDLGDNPDTGGAVDTPADDAQDRSFHTSTVEANRSIEQGGGIGQEELDAQADPSRDARQDPLGQSTAEDNFKNITGSN
jgi:hypothetical protein